jgi:hypothetical protein
MNTNDKDKNKKEDKVEPFYHENEEYRSAFFGKVPDKVIEEIPQKYNEKLIETLVGQLTHPGAREIKDEVLKVLKEGESQDLLVEIIGMKEYVKHRQVLLATCWESGLDFSEYLEKFIALLSDKLTDTPSALEIVTIIEEMPGPFTNERIDSAIKGLDSLSATDPVKNELLTIIRQHLSGLKTA